MKEAGRVNQLVEVNRPPFEFVEVPPGRPVRRVLHPDTGHEARESGRRPEGRGLDVRKRRSRLAVVARITRAEREGVPRRAVGDGDGGAVVPEDGGRQRRPAGHVRGVGEELLPEPEVRHDVRAVEDGGRVRVDVVRRQVCVPQRLVGRLLGVGLEEVAVTLRQTELAQLPELIRRRVGDGDLVGAKLIERAAVGLARRGVGFGELVGDRL